MDTLAPLSQASVDISYLENNQHVMKYLLTDNAGLAALDVDGCVELINTKVSAAPFYFDSEKVDLNIWNQQTFRMGLKSLPNE